MTTVWTATSTPGITSGAFAQRFRPADEFATCIRTAVPQVSGRDSICRTCVKCRSRRGLTEASCICQSERFGRLYMQADNWHTDAAGYELIAQAVVQALK